MYISAKTLDDLLHRILQKLLASKTRVRATRGGNVEIAGALLQLTNPRARLSRSESKRVLFSGLGELMWYLAGSNRLDFIEYYVSRYAKESDDGVTVHGGYGPRLFRMRGENQIENILELLRRKPESRRAVIQLFNAEDLAVEREVPCTCTLQFMIRDRRLHLFTSMRSNDAFVGLPHDIFAFTMMQEIIARSLRLDVGTYKHAVGSLHLYDVDRQKARTYLKEGWQPTTVTMPEMPAEDPWPALHAIKAAERAIRKRGRADTRRLRLDPYWMDIVRLLQVYGYAKRVQPTKINAVKRQMSARIFDPYIEQKKRTAQRKRRERSIVRRVRS